MLQLELYHIVLHPQLKLKYFQQHSWKKEWIVTAEVPVREEFAKYCGLQEPVEIMVCIALCPPV